MMSDVLVLLFGANLFVCSASSICSQPVFSVLEDPERCCGFEEKLVMLNLCLFDLQHVH